MFSGIRSILNGLTSDPAGTIITFLYVAVCILFSLILHECAHGYAALKCGDPTDPLGTICMIFMRIGWAKPVPINPRNFRNFRRDYIIVSLAGIVTNLVLCILSLIISAVLARIIWGEEMIRYFAQSGDKNLLINVYKGLFANKVYAGQFADIKMYAQVPWLMYIQRLFLMLAQMNLGLAIFNLIPVPPLDGYRFLDQFVFKGQLSLNVQTMQIIHIVFLVVCISGLLTGFLTTINSTVMGWLTSGVSLII